MIGSTLVGCTPPAKDAGEVIDTDTDSGSEGESGSSIGTTGDSVSSTTVSSTTVSSTTDESTGGDVPQACIEQGWDVSLATFASFSEAANGTYYYVRQSGGSGFEGLECVYETTIEAAQGVIVRRSFAIDSPIPGETVEDCIEQPWVEEADAIGTHESVFAPRPYTMEELYAGCCEILALQPAEEYSITFSVDDAGIVDACDGWYADCADGCGIGVDDFYGFYLQEFAFAN